MTAALPQAADDTEDQYHYHVVRRALAAIDAAGGAPLSLDDLATHVGLSPAHLQRLFTRWVGISPKRYQQFLTLNHAKTMLSTRHSLLSTATELGLSGTSRLHDLFLTWEAMTPGEYAKSGEGMMIRLGWADSPFGPALLALSDRGLCGLGFGGEISNQAAEADMIARWPKATFTADDAAIAPTATAVFTGKGNAHLHLTGAPFQLKVWEALLSVPDGCVTTYSDIAAAIGNPKAVRAVGTAVGRNPISYLIPCHRALRKSGALGGYHWGLPVKRMILAYETAKSTV
ncbi:MAG: bifunctional helix-turn-helix domain-containing protein/methylated-DNA--[protein]-cysteine S-methyltransferase [Maritimibacter sp.]